MKQENGHTSTVNVANCDIKIIQEKKRVCTLGMHLDCKQHHTVLN